MCGRSSGFVSAKGRGSCFLVSSVFFLKFLSSVVTLHKKCSYQKEISLSIRQHHDVTEIDRRKLNSNSVMGVALPNANFRRVRRTRKCPPGPYRE